MGETQEESLERQERWAKGVMPTLLRFADQVGAFTNEVFAMDILHDWDNGADIMALSFVTKQREHLRSIRVLIAAKQHRDGLLIARTMIEGRARLLWAFRDTPERTDQWLWFCAILDWRRMLDLEAKGVRVDPVAKAELAELVRKHGPSYLSPRVRKELAQAEANGKEYRLPEDPWDYKWTDTKVSEMFGEVQGDRMYRGAYGHSSEWVHWGPQSVLGAFELGDWNAGAFTEEDWRSAVEALRLACQSVLQCLEILDVHFSLGLAERIGGFWSTMERIRDEANAEG